MMNYRQRKVLRIIINHVIDGIELAKKNNLPDRVIDFIRTHHGTSVVYYFLNKQSETNQDFDEVDFAYRVQIHLVKKPPYL